MSLKVRSYDKEFLDSEDIATPDLYRNLQELDVINHRLGGYKASLKGLQQVLETEKKVRSILDVGFGGGDSIKQLAIYSQKHASNLFFYGVDLKQDCVNYAEKNLAALNNTQLICDDYRHISSDLLNQVDVIHCSLFLHHLKDAEIIALFQFAKAHRCIILANDLHRHWLAYYSIKCLTALFSKSYLVRNDAPLSVRRGFKRSELIELLKQAGFSKYTVTWSWAFRFIIIARP